MSVAAKKHRIKNGKGPSAYWPQACATNWESPKYRLSAVFIAAGLG